MGGLPKLIAICVFAYAFGGIPLGWLAVRWRSRIDLRAVGTGNVGTANIYRNFGGGLPYLVGPGQFLQGLLPVVIAGWWGAPTAVQAGAGLLAVAGNGWPPWLRFNGGRGVAVATGAVAALSPPLLVLLLGFYLLGLAGGRIAVGVLIGFAALPVADLRQGALLTLQLLSLLALIVLRRLEGLPEDVRRYGNSRRVILRRLLFDERPGRGLVGPIDLPAR